MAAVSLSPTPVPITVMSSRRAPLASNPNVVNSPLRGASALANYAKQKRSYATIQREEPYGQPPPIKKQALENGTHRPVRSPAKPSVSRTQVLVQRASATTTRSSTIAARERLSRVSNATSTSRGGQDVENDKETWRKHYRAKFPKMVFYFESIPDDVRAKLTKRVTYFGARQEPFFSIDVTHVITTRTIPAERSGDGASGASVSAATESENHKQSQQQSADEQPQTINPSLLDRNTAARRKLLFEFRQAPMPSQQADDVARRNQGSKTRNNDVLHKAREMGKKIWSLDKFQTMLSVLLEAEGHNAGGNYATRTSSLRSQYGASKASHEPNLLQLLNNERINGPSDRDPTAVNRELVYFKGPHIYVWDMEEKQKPIMARDYPKVANKADGEWPQFRSVGNGRCPFVEEIEVAPEKDYRKTREREKARAAAAAAAAAISVKKEDDPVPILKPPETISLTRPVTGKRTIAEMEEGAQNRAAGAMPARDAAEMFKPVTNSKDCEARAPQNAFISRAAGPGRLFAGEPVASGMQPSNITSAIRSQMISSTSGINGAKAGTSKEIHGLQRKVLQKATTPASQDPSSRRVPEVPVDVASSRSTHMGRQTSRPIAAQDDECHSQRAAVTAAEGQDRKSRPQQLLKSKKDLKPGYCENCQDKFRDFDEHIASRKHRKFAENSDNWIELDMLLAQLKRIPRHFSSVDSDSEDAW